MSDVSVPPVVVTRHPTLIQYLRDIGLADETSEVIEHASVDQVRGRDVIEVRGWDVIGVLPMHLAAEARSVTEVPLHVPPGLRGAELSPGELREYAGAPVTYTVRRRANPEREVARGLRDLADWLDANPEVPCDYVCAAAHTYTVRGVDAVRSACESGAMGGHTVTLTEGVSQWEVELVREFAAHVEHRVAGTARLWGGKVPATPRPVLPEWLTANTQGAES